MFHPTIWTPLERAYSKASAVFWTGLLGPLGNEARQGLLSQKVFHVPFGHIYPSADPELVTNALIGRFKIVAESGGIFRHCHWFRPWRSIHDVDRHSGLPPEHQVKWSVSGGGMDAGVICHGQSSQVVFRLKWSFRNCSSQHREECSVTPLH